MTVAKDFWSRRKAQVKAEKNAHDVAVEAENRAGEMAVQEEKSDEQLLAEFNLPDPDTLEEGDDFTAFMSKAVPDRLRRRALRRLWVSNPVLANVDGLIEYGEDYTDAATVVENLQTAYQVGKGMKKHVDEIALPEETAEPKAAMSEEEPEGLALDETAEIETEEFAEPETLTAPKMASSDMQTDKDPPRRRMRFAFAD